MKTQNIVKLNLITIILSIPMYSFAQSNLSVGKVLNQQEVKQLKGSKIKINDQSFDMIPSSMSSSQTYLINRQGNVGVSDNSVFVSKVSPQKFKANAQHIINSATSVKYYEHLELVSLHYQTFSQALEAYNQLAKIFNESQVSLPIQFNEPNLR